MNRLKIWCAENMYNIHGYFDGNKSRKKWFEKRNLLHIFEQLECFKVKYNLSSIAEVAYWLKYDISVKPTCKICDGALIYRCGYGVTCNNKKCKNTHHQSVMFERYGVDNYAKSKDFKELTKTQAFKNKRLNKKEEIEQKKRETCLKKYGVDNPMKNNIIKQKLEDTMIERFGVKTNLMCLSEESKIRNCISRNSNECKEKRSNTIKNFSKEKRKTIKDKTFATLEENFGSVENSYTQRHVKIKKTMKERYGVENSQQNPEIHEKTQKSRYKFKNFQMPSGKIVQIQGYEHLALEHIFSNQLFDEEQIEIRRKNMPEIWYLHPDGKKRRYFADIFVKEINKIIEVKSDYTFKNAYEINLNKKQACIEGGFSFEFWIFSVDGLEKI